MASNINPAFPVFGSPTTASVRTNFQHAKEEIEALQTGKLAATAQAEINALKTPSLITLVGSNDVSEIFQQCLINDTLQVVQFTAETLNNKAAQYSWDIASHEIVFITPGFYSLSLAFHVGRKIATGAADWTLWAQSKEPPSSSYVNVPGAARRISTPLEANSKIPGALVFNTKITVANTRIRFVQACSDVTKQVGVISYPAAGIYPAVGTLLSVHKIGSTL